MAERLSDSSSLKTKIEYEKREESKSRQWGVRKHNAREGKRG